MLKIKEARQYLLENQAEKAFEILQQVEHDDDETPDYFLVLGSCLAALGQSQEALENYFNALLLCGFSSTRCWKNAMASSFRPSLR